MREKEMKGRKSRRVAPAVFDLRLQVLEIATRADAARFAVETMALAREQAARSAKAKPDDYDARRGLFAPGRSLKETTTL